MQTNKPRHPRSFLFLLSTLVLLAMVFLTPVVTGADTDPPAQAQVEPDTDKQTPVDAAADAAEKQPEAGEAEVEQVKEFKPSEQIGADSAVAFPIDI